MGNITFLKYNLCGHNYLADLANKINQTIKIIEKKQLNQRF